MKRLRKILFHSSSLFSALLLVAAVATWTNTYRDGLLLRAHRNWVEDDRRARTTVLWVASGNGSLGVHWARTSTDEFRYVEFYRRRLAETPRFGEPPFGRHHEVSRSGTTKLVLPSAAWPVPVDGFKWQRWSSGGGHRYKRFGTVVLPYWPIAAVLAVLPTIWLARFLSGRRHPAGCCPGCGYDLRASPERCPECGRATTPTARPVAPGAHATP